LLVVKVYISNEYNRKTGLTVDRCGLSVSIYITNPLLDAALPLKSIMKNRNEEILEGIDISKPHLSTVKPAFLIYSFETIFGIGE